MTTAYLIDHAGVGGGMEYIRRQIAAHPGEDALVFTSERGECTAAAVNSFHPDKIHANHLRALAQLLRNPFVQPRAKVVFTVHGIHLRKYDFLPKTPANRLRRFLRLSLERYLYAKCDTIIALTPTDANDVRRLYGKNLNVVIEPNTVSPGDFTSDAPLRYEPDSFAFVCIARFNFQKGIDVLLRAIALAQDSLRRGNRRTLLIGGGETLDEMKRLADTSGIADLVVFAGEIPQAGAYMTCAKTLVAPSRWEGMPYLLLEAVARNRRIVASDCPGNRDVLAGVANATLFPVEDATRLAALLTA